MNITILAPGHVKESYFAAGIAEYQKRLGAYCRLNIVELPEVRLPEQPGQKEIEKALEKEALSFAAAMPQRCYTVALCIEGRQLSSAAFSEKLHQIMLDGQSHIVFLIGSSYGLSPALKASCDFRLSFSEMTFPHTMMRLILTEQLYRAFQIAGGGKYHK